MDCPSPGKDAQGFKQKALAMDQIEVLAKRIEARHALFVMDSCFAGTIFKVRANADRIPPAISDRLAKPVRQFLTAGDDGQTVPDQSIFRRYFIRGIAGEADVNRDGWVTATELATFVHDHVTDDSHGTQTPRDGKIQDVALNEGEFVFKVGTALGLVGTARPIDAFPPAPSSSDLDLSSLQAQAEQNRIRKGWQEWQARMQSSYEKVQKLAADSDLPVASRRQAWQKFLENYPQENPFSQDDRRLRQLALAAIAQLDQSADKPKDIDKSSNTEANQEVASSMVIQRTVTMPDWVKDPTRGGTIIGSYGTANKKLSGLQFQIQTALQAGRRELANTLESKISSIWKNWTREGGELYAKETRAIAMEMIEYVARIATNQAVENLTPHEAWMDTSTGDLYVRLEIDKVLLAELGKRIVDHTKKEMEARKALLASTIESEKAFAELETLISKEFALTKTPTLGKAPWASATGQDQYGTWADLTVGGVTQRMRLIKAGTFTMGSPADEAGRGAGASEVQHQVTLTKDYWLGDSEVTRGLWQAVMGENTRWYKADNDRPMEQVTWDKCQGFFTTLNNQVRSGGFSLPTEAQWEYACRAGTTTPFSFGATITPDQVNYCGKYPYVGAAKGLYREKSTSVKNLPANAWGLHEMHGNVAELCSDWYERFLQNAVTDPVGPASGTSRVIRGGGWASEAKSCRAAYRSWITSSDNIVGFRLTAPVQAGP